MVSVRIGYVYFGESSGTIETQAGYFYFNDFACVAVYYEYSCAYCFGYYFPLVAFTIS